LNLFRTTLLPFCVFAALHPHLSAQKQSTTHWVGSWASSQQTPEPANALPAEDLRLAILRQIVHLSIGGDQIRIHVSNVFGTQPLHLASVHVAKPISTAAPVIDTTTDRQLTFNNTIDVTIPAGAEYLSDPIAFHAAPLSDLAITIQFDEPPTGETSHPGSRSTSYLASSASPAARDLPDAKHIDHWFQLSGVDVAETPPSSAIVTLGDSITDGHGATTNGNDRWTDILAARLQASPTSRSIAVLNQGIGGNHLLTDGLGPNALARFDRDVLAQPGVKFVIVLEGVNDLGGATRTQEISQAEHDALVARILSSYTQMIERAHAHGLHIYGATITPYTGSDYYHPGPMSEADRKQINTWIRSPGHFDACVDFDKAIADPADPKRLLPAYDSGDHLHPSPAGYKAMANAVPLALFGTAP
jgi:lysophospholipase L1-like esterase